MDNALDASQLDSLLPLPDNGCLMVVTSRQHFCAPDIFDENLPVLTPEDSQQLLTKVAPHIGDYAGKLAKLCGYLPEALRTAASALGNSPNYSPQDFLSQMNNVRRRLSLTGVELSLATSSELLSDELRGLWFELGVFPASFDAEAAAAVWSTSNVDAKNLLLSLWRYSLVEFDVTSARYHLHDLVRDFILSRLTQFALDLARSRHSAYYADLLCGANYVYLLGDTGTSLALEMIDADWLNIEAGQRWAANRLHETRYAARLCLQYASGGNSLIRLRTGMTEQIEWLTHGAESVQYLSRPNPRRHSVFEAEVAILTNLGYAHLAIGKRSTALEYFKRANERLEDIHIPPNSSYASKGVGDAYRLFRKFDKALEIHLATQNAIDLLGIIPYFGMYKNDPKELTRRRISVLESLGEDYLELKNYGEALYSFKQQLLFAEESGDRHAQLRALGHVGLTYLRVGQYEPSIRCQKRSLSIAEDLGDREGQANALYNLALALLALKDREAAIEHAREALLIYKSIESPFANDVLKALQKWSRNRIDYTKLNSSYDKELLRPPQNALNRPRTQ
jgi:tetratricopeptide (TPR) repeat protein